MRLFKQLASGVLLTIGGIFLIFAISVPFDQDKSREAKTEEFVGCLIIGVPLTAWGGWIAWSLRRENQLKEGDRLRSTFFQVAKENDGYVSVMQFSMAANVPGDQAKAFLDERAKEFSANYEVDEQGGIFYQFPIKSVDLDDAKS